MVLAVHDFASSDKCRHAYPDRVRVHISIKVSGELLLQPQILFSLKIKSFFLYYKEEHRKMNNDQTKDDGDIQPFLAFIVPGKSRMATIFPSVYDSAFLESFCSSHSERENNLAS